MLSRPEDDIKPNCGPASARSGMQRQRFPTGGASHAPVGQRSAAMQPADFIAAWIAQVGKIELARSHFAPAGRILDAAAAVGDPGVVESLDLLGVGARETDGAAIGVRRRI